MDKFSLKEESAPPVDIIKAPARDKNNEVVWVDCAVMFPHRVFAHYSDGEKRDFEHVFGSPAQIQEWWAGQDLGDPKLHNHPLLHQPNYRSQFVLAFCFLFFVNTKRNSFVSFLFLKGKTGLSALLQRSTLTL